MTDAAPLAFPGDLNQLRSLYYAAFQHSFTRAAEQLTTTQPSVSTHIKSLEGLIGQTLFARHARGVSLTEAGQALFELVEPLIEGVDQLQGRLSDRLGDAGVQEVRLAAGHELLLHLAGPALRSFRETHPDVRLVVFSSDRGQTLEMVASHEVDFGIASSVDPSGEVVFEHILSDELFLICSPEHPLAQHQSVTIADVAPYPLLMPNPASSARVAIEAAAAQAGKQLRVAMELERWHVIKEFVALDQGVAFVPGFSVAADADRLAIRRVRSGLPPLAYGIVTRRGRHLPLTVRHLIEAIRAEGGRFQAGEQVPVRHP
jgi:LysR family nitrogen assimilation transcriptional regulator